jgi:hypothetical protein
MSNSDPTSEQLRVLGELGLTPPNTRKTCSMILDWIRKGGVEGPKRIAILQEGEATWVGKKVRAKDGTLTGVVLFIMPKTPESLLQGFRSEAEHAFRHPLDAKIQRDGDGKRIIASCGRIAVVVE